MHSNTATTNPWDRACRIPLARQQPFPYEGTTARLDRGVNFFITALEAMGAVTLFSCEGHPGGFYILFHAPVMVAETVYALGYFHVQVEGRGQWSIRMPDIDLLKSRLRSRGTRSVRLCAWTERRKRRFLRTAAGSWEAKLKTKGFIV